MIVNNHGKDCDTFKTATQFIAAVLAVKPDTDDTDEEEERETLAAEFKRDILEDYLTMLRQEVEYRLKDETVDEDIRANEYTFTADGERFG